MFAIGLFLLIFGGLFMVFMITQCASAGERGRYDEPKRAMIRRALLILSFAMVAGGLALMNYFGGPPMVVSGPT